MRMANLEPGLSTAKPPLISAATSAIAKPHRPPKPAKKLKRKLYEKELRKLQVELCHLQQWAKTTGAKMFMQRYVEQFPRRYQYSKARDLMLHATDTECAPWYIVRTDDKRRGRLNCIAHILSLLPYERM